MALLKTAITLPAEMLLAVDRVAKARGESRSSFIRSVLTAALRADRDAGITRKLDELFTGSEAADEQRRITRELEGAVSPWPDEGW